MSGGCPVCGGRWVGDGYRTVVHCEHAEVPPGVEPDADPVACAETVVRVRVFLTGEDLVRFLKARKPQGE